MDTRIIWIVFITCFIGTTWCAADKRNMTECHNGGVQCSRWSNCQFDASKSNFTCVCVAGYKGDLCEEDRNECDIGSAPCKKRGVCHNSIGSFRCDCLPGWQGSHCQTPDGSGLSTCLTGYTGVNCTDDFDECTQWAENPCEHNSTCKNTPGNFSCSCVTGWEGRICNEDINECNLTSGLCHNGGNCTNIPGAYKCVCPYPYTGPACDVISTTIPTTTSTSTTTPTTPIQSTSIGLTSVSSVQTQRTTKTANLSLSTKPTPSVPTSVSGSKTSLSYTSKALPSQNSTTHTHAASSSGFTTMPENISNIATSYYQTTTNSTHAKALKAAPEGGSSDGGGINVGVIVGPIVGLLVIAGAVGAGIIVYKKYYRKSHKVDASDESKVESTKQEQTSGDTNKNSKWKPQTADPAMNAEPATIGNGVVTTP